MARASLPGFDCDLCRERLCTSSRKRSKLRSQPETEAELVDVASASQPRIVSTSASYFLMTSSHPPLCGTFWEIQ